MLIPWSKPKLDKKDKYHLNRAFKSSWISGGEYISKFQNIYKYIIPRKYAYATSSGTSAIHLAYLALNLKSNDEIIVPSFGYLASANIAKLMGLKLTFADVDKHSYCISLKNIKSKINKKTKAVVVINTYGNIFELKKIEKYLKSKKIYLIEDAAESLGCKYGKKNSGSFGDISTFSFHATKNITTGEGGMVLTNNKLFGQRIRLYRSHGVDKERYKHYVHGHNFRLSNLLAAIGFSQSKRISTVCKKRLKLYNYYLKYLNKQNINLQNFSSNSNIIPWTVAFTLKKTFLRERLVNYLKKNGIETRKGFYSTDRLKLFKSRNRFTNSNFLSKNVICLPFYLDLKETEIKYICLKINHFLKKNKY